jgi:predicted NACHT family NTPase
VPGLQAVQQYSKLIVFGKPGAGKTTFLKYLAIQCMDDHVQKNRFPVFIILKDFAENPNSRAFWSILPTSYLFVS